MGPDTGAASARIQLIRPEERTIDQMPEGVVASNVGFLFSGRRYNFREFQYILDVAKMLRDAGKWGIGDALLEAQRQMGEDFVQLMDQIDYDLGTLYNLMSVCRAFPIEQRVLGVPPSFHMVVAPIARGGPEGPEIARTWLENTVAFGWTRADLTREVRRSLLPPTMRAEMPDEDETAETNEALFERPLTVKPLYSVAEFVAAVDQLIAAADAAGVSREAIEPTLRFIRYYRYGGSFS